MDSRFPEIRHVENYATQYLKQISEDFDNVSHTDNYQQNQQKSGKRYTTNQHPKYKKFQRLQKQNFSQHQEYERKIKSLSRRKIYTSSCNQPIILSYQQIDVSPWNTELSSQPYRNSFKQLSNIEHPIINPPQKKSLTNQKQPYYQLKQKIKKVDRSRKNKSMITRYSENAVRELQEIKSQKIQNNLKNKENIHEGYIQMISVNRPPRRIIEKGNENRKEDEGIQKGNGQILSNITNIVLKKNHEQNFKIKSQCPKTSLTENIENQTGILGKNQRQKSYGITQGLASRSQISHHPKLENLYRRCIEMQRKNMTSSCEKIKKQILYNIEKQGLLGFYQPGAQVFNSSINKIFMKYSKKKKQNQKKLQLQKKSQSLKNNTEIKSQQDENFNLHKYLMSQKALSKNQNQIPETGNILYIHNRKKQQYKKIQPSHLSRHLYEKYKILLQKR